MGNKSNGTKRLYKYIAAVAAAVFIFVFTAAATYADNGVIDEVRAYLKNYYVDEVPDSTLNLSTVDDIIKEINKTDPHTVYFTADKYKDFTDSINNTFSGIGVQIEMVPEGVQIITVFDGSPAQEAKLKAGDIIMMANNHMLGGLPDNVAVGYIKGPEGTKVNLRVKRDDELLNFDITRRQINAPTVNGKILDNHIGYIQITSFGADTGSKFGVMLSEQENKHVDSYIIDLRYNGGGYLTTALDIAGYFIGDNLALITRGRINGEEKDNAVKHNILINKPVIFLINDYSASASEILSGAVKDYDKAYFVGVKSYGKGSVQQPIELSNKDVLKMTIDKFYSPKGNTINKVGITPELNVPDEVDSMRVAELIFDSKTPATDNNGYVKITINNKTVVTKLARVEEQDYWQPYKQLVKLATTGGSISLGSGKSWKAVGKDKLTDLANMYYPNYKQLTKLKTVDTNKTFTIKFNSKMQRSSINNKNIELIDAATGARLPITFSSIKDKEVVVNPKDGLKKDKEYYLVVNPLIKKFDNKALGYGMLEDITTLK